ncbi:MAG: Bax inhibitor-1 family protein [Candidatus Eremiobacteraeota bacterium]|nr:Bax inhibitor-1 family protein [Candidatus Eremiobacteraeota bacterium]
MTYRAAGRVHAASTPTLLGQVLGITGLGLLVTAAASYFFQGLAPGSILGWAAFIAGFILLFAINAVRENEPLALTLYYLFTFLMGVWIGPVIGRYISVIGPAVVYQAAMTTGLGMLALATIVYATSIDFRRFSGIAFVALLALVLVGIVSAFTHWVHPTVFAWATLAIFTLITLIDFTRIKAGGDGYTPVQMAVQLYLDAINIFLALLQIFGGGRSRD